MNIGAILIAVMVVSLLGLIIGLLLGLAGKKLEVEVDERILQVRDCLAGSNCGGCGLAGCDACAAAMVEGKVPPHACAPAGAEAAKKIGEILGVNVETTEPKVAFVHCGGTCDKTQMKSQYYGIQDCQKAAMMPGGTDKACSYGCLGFGSCVRACSFQAIHIQNGVAVVEREKCTGCGTCMTVCPKNLIELVPASAKHLLRCQSHDKGKDVRAVCSAGCIGCGACAKQCESGAITMEGNLAIIDPEKCTNCGKCAQKCPRKGITE